MSALPIIIQKKKLLGSKLNYLTIELNGVDYYVTLDVGGTDFYLTL